MLKKLSIVLALLPIHMFAQTEISGRLTDAATKKPVEFVTVYINGTTKGTISSEKGNFTLKEVDFPCQIIFSHVGYYPQAISLTTNPKTELKISLKEKNIDIAEVVVKDKNMRARNVELFKENFLGNDEWGQKAKLTNDKSLIFNWEYKKVKMNSGVKMSTQNLNNSTNSNLELAPDGTILSITKPHILHVSASKPIKIELPLLGYTLHVDLVDFTFEKASTIDNSSTCSFLGYYFFQPITPKSKSQAKKFNKNRVKAFNNSSQHFFQSLFDKKLLANGYRIFEEIKTNDPGEVFQEIYLDSCITTTGNSADIIGFNNRRLHVFYYPSFSGNPIDLTINKGKIPVQSPIYFMNDTCTIQSNGTITDNSIMFAPFIGTKKVGAMLPDNFRRPID